MKVKSTKGINPIPRIESELLKLGFRGGVDREAAKVRSKTTYFFMLVEPGAFVQKPEGGASRDMSQRLCVITVVLNEKDNSVAWKYDSSVYEKYAMSSSQLHGKLLNILGRES
jgi:hypothetical protein